jgi:DNA invertase Pin-like site-specific DNA recombinase
MKKAFSYVRFSSGEQKLGASKERQLERARDYAKRKKWDLEERSFQDLGVSAYSGANVKTGALGAFLDAVKKRKVPRGSVLLVEAMDRVSRQNPWDAMEVIQALVNNGVEVITLDDEREYNQETLRDTKSSLLTRLVGKLELAFDESERKSYRVGDAWHRLKEDARANKTPITKRCPMWLEVRDGQFFPIPERVKIVEKIFSLRLHGFGKRLIAEKLNQEKVPTFNPKVKSWGSSYVHKILRNRAVVGEYQPYKRSKDGKRETQGDPIENFYPVIIPLGQFQQAQDELVKCRLSSAGQKPLRQLSNLFSGLLFFEDTDTPIHFVNKGTAKRGNGNWKYLAPSRANGRRSFWRYSDFEEAFLDEIELDWSRIGEERDKAFAALSDTAAALEAEVISLQKKKQNWEDKIAEGFNISKDRFNDMDRELAKKQGQFAVALKKLKANKHPLSASEIRLLRELAGTSFEARLKLRREIRRIVRKIQLYPSKREFRVFYNDLGGLFGSTHQV